MTVPATLRPARLAHIHLGEAGGAERFFVRLSAALAERGVEQIAFLRPDRTWRGDIHPAVAVREVRFSRSVLKRPVIHALMRRRIDRFGAGAVLAWMQTAARWLPPPRPDRPTFVRLGDFPDGFRAFFNAGAIIGNTPEVVRRSIAGGWPEPRTHLLTNFVPPIAAAPQPRAAFDTPADAFLVLALGRFVPRKRFGLLLEAAARVPGCHLWLLGEGPERAAVAARAAGLGVADRVRFLGWQADPSGFLVAADAICCPSVEEPLGNVVLEGWAARRPVVATASEGPSWLIEDGVSGLLVPLDDPDALAAALRRLSADRKLRARLADGGAAKLEADHGEEAICRRYMALLFGDGAVACRASAAPQAAAASFIRSAAKA